MHVIGTALVVVLSVVALALIVAILALPVGWWRHRQFQIRAEAMSQAQWSRARADVLDAIYRIARGRRWIASMKVVEALNGMSVVVIDEVVRDWNARGYLELKDYKPVKGTDGIFSSAFNQLAGRMRLTHHGQAVCERYQETGRGHLWETVMEFEGQDEAPRYNITIHSAGQVNIDPTTVNNIQSHIESIGQHGNQRLANVLTRLTDAALESELGDDKRTQVLDAIEDVSEGARQSPQNRRLPRIMRAIAYIGTAASATTALGKVWTEYGHVLEDFFR